MIINKKLDRLRQWTDERMGAKSRTDTSDDFKELEIEMGLRYEGMRENQRTASLYLKNMGQRMDADEKEKATPLALMGNAMLKHGEDYADDSTFGQCLALYGRSNERLARVQDSFVTKASDSWLESTERSLAQMKEYQAARKKLESRRLAYDTAQTKMEKDKKDNFRLEEEARVQKVKYEEAYEDTHQRMLDIREAESDTIDDLGELLEAQLAYHDQCRQILLELKRSWPGTLATTTTTSAGAHSRQNTPFSDDRDAPVFAIERPRSRVISNSTPVSRAESIDRDFHRRPSVPRSTTFDSPRQRRPEHSSLAPPPPLPPSLSGAEALLRVQSNPVSAMDQRRTLRPAASYSSLESGGGADTYGTSPASSLASVTTASLAGARSVSGERRKAPPPPPPSRAKKPPPPPPPMRRGIATGS